MVVSKSIRLISIVVLLFFVHSTQAALNGKGPAASDGDLYPNTHYYVSEFADKGGSTIGTMKSPTAPGTENANDRQINKNSIYGAVK